MKQQINGLLCALVCTILISCGGGNGNGETHTDETAQSFMTTGPITGFGSVFVNGVRYHTDEAQVTADDHQLSDVTDLSVGMVVTVTGDPTTRVATSVTFNEDIKGPVDHVVNDFLAPFNILGQRVIVDAATVVDDSVTLPLATGDLLEISGLRMPDDSLLATFVEHKEAMDVEKYEVIGAARLVDPTTRTMMLGALQVDYSSAVLDDFGGGQPSEGQLVEVKDELVAYIPGSNFLNATKVEPISVATPPPLPGP